MWIICIPLSLIARSRPEDYGYLPDGDTNVNNSSEQSSNIPESADVPITLKQAITGKYFWGLIAMLGAQSISIGGLLAHQIAYLEGLGFSTTLAASTIGVYFGISAIGRFIVGFLTDWTDWRRVFIVMILGQAIGMLILANVSTYSIAILASCITVSYTHLRAHET